MEDYSKAIIYTIKTDNGLYVGSTLDLHNRKTKHKNSLKKNYKGKGYKLYNNIRENNFNYQIEPYKPFPCNNRRELEEEEQRIIDELKPNLNSKRAYRRTEEEWAAYRKEYKRKYRQQTFTCECGCIIRKNDMARHKNCKKHFELMKNL